MPSTDPRGRYGTFQFGGKLFAPAAPPTQQRLLFGSVAPAGAVQRTFGRRVSGALASTGVVARTFGRSVSGALAPAGALSKRLARTFVGTLVAHGRIRLPRSLPGGLTLRAVTAVITSRIPGATLVQRPPAEGVVQTDG